MHKNIRYISFIFLFFFTTIVYAKNNTNQKLNFLNNCKLGTKKNFHKETDQIVVIGAGVNGLAAVQSFIKNGVPPKHIVVIEKNEAAGGKVESFRYQDHSYELGASIIIPGVHEQIEKLRDKYGLTTRRLGSGLPSPKLEEYKRYLEDYSTKFNQTGPASEYHLLAKDGFKNIHPSLKKNWMNFIHENHFDSINNSLRSILAGAGYSNYQHNPTEASLIARLVSPRLIKSLFIDHNTFEIFNNGGWQELWIKIAADLQDQGVTFYYQSEVRNIKRNQTGKMEVSGLSKNSPFSYQTDHVLYTADLYYLPDLMPNLLDCEKKLFKNIVHNQLYSYLVDVKGFEQLKNLELGIEVHPYLTGKKNKKGITEDMLGWPVMMIKSYKNSNVFNVYALGKPDISEAQMAQNITKYFRETKSSISIIHYKKWSYFPRIKGDSQTGLNQLMRLQGHGGLWMSGEIFSFSAVHLSYKNGEDFAESITKGDL
jgi:phytoene dehydrogenase-like protein